MGARGTVEWRFSGWTGDGLRWGCSKPTVRVTCVHTHHQARTWDFGTCKSPLKKHHKL